MAAKVFVSCGQATSEERDTAAAVRGWLESQGFEVFVALETQSLSDINSGTIGQLRQSDYYVFIDFPRERILEPGEELSSPVRFRGSLFTHQELVVAYLLGFPDAVFVKHRDVELRDIAQFQMANAANFSGYDEVLPLVQHLITQRTWSPAFSRNLVASRVRRRDTPILYGPQRRNEFIFFAHICNGRSDRAALNVVARLASIHDQNGQLLPLRDRTRLKWAGDTYQGSIFPEDEAVLDIFALDANAPANVFLHSTFGQQPEVPILNTSGEYTLTYQVAADGYVMQEFRVRLTLTGDLTTTTAVLI
jgi:hypothetical protein